jgi:phosphoheptose isomerase
LAELQSNLLIYNSNEFHEILNKIEDVYLESGIIFVAGNGGSSTIAEHISVDWNKGIYLKTGKSLNTRSLVSNIAELSAWANDTDWKFVFSNQIRSFLAGSNSKENLKTKCLAVLISSSGMSENMIQVANYARKNDIITIGLSGFGDNILKKVVDFHLTFPSTCMQIVEDVHSIFGHLVYDYLTTKYENKFEFKD